MSPATARCMHIAFVLVGVGGLMLAWQLEVYDPGPEPEDPALALAWTGRHPWADELRALHIVSAPLLVFALGLVWLGHAWPRVESGFRARRWTGVTLVSLAGPMVLSGVCLQVASEPAWRAAWRWLHLGTGVAWCALYTLHLTWSQLARLGPPRAQNSVR